MKRRAKRYMKLEVAVVENALKNKLLYILRLNFRNLQYKLENREVILKYFQFKLPTKPINKTNGATVG